jgi:uncharacterized integral membrane protein
MRRFHLVEFEDYAWFPKAVRDGITDYLRFFVTVFDIYFPIVPYIKELLDNSSSDTIIELGSGGGGGIEKILNHLDKITEVKTKVLMTDFFPNIQAFKLIKERNNGRFDFIYYSVDASSVPENLKGVRTLFSAFHHFNPKTAKAVLRDAVEKKSPIGIFDGAERKLRYIAGVIVFTLLFIFIVPLFTKPIKLSRFFYTYVIPLIPLFALFDGIVSMLRMYTPEELLMMAEEAGEKKFVWKSGKVKHKLGAYVVYLIGYPKK